mgnify:FL=1
MYENFSDICTVNRENMDDVFVLVPIQKGVFREITLKSLIENSIVVCKNVDNVSSVAESNKVETVYPKIETVKPVVETLHAQSDIEEDSVDKILKSTDNLSDDAPSIEDKAIDYIEHTSRGKKPRIDYGKLEALKKAGWPVKEIALELKCTPAAIYNYLKKHPIN